MIESVRSLSLFADRPQVHFALLLAKRRKTYSFACIQLTVHTESRGKKKRESRDRGERERETSEPRGGPWLIVTHAQCAKRGCCFGTYTDRRGVSAPFPGVVHIDLVHRQLRIHTTAGRRRSGPDVPRVTFWTRETAINWHTHLSSGHTPRGQSLKPTEPWFPSNHWWRCPSHVTAAARGGGCTHGNLRETHGTPPNRERHGPRFLPALSIDGRE